MKQTNLNNIVPSTLMAVLLGVKPNTWRKHRQKSKEHPQYLKVSNLVLYPKKVTLDWAMNCNYGKFKRGITDEL